MEDGQVLCVEKLRNILLNNVSRKEHSATSHFLNQWFKHVQLVTLENEASSHCDPSLQVGHDSGDKHGTCDFISLSAQIIFAVLGG